MKWVILWKKAIIPLIIVLIIGSPVFSAFANSGGAFSFFPQGPISPKSELAIRHQTPHVTMDALGNTYAVWTDYRRGNRDIYFAHRPAGGTWQGNVKVNDDTGTASQSWPDIVVDPTGNAYAVWEDLRNGSSDIYFAYRPKGGAWEANTKLNHETGNYDKVAPAIAVDANGNAYVVWNDSRNGNGDIYFSYRPAGGGWQPEEKVNKDSGNAQQSSPRIASDPNGNVMVVWQDDRNGNEDIYSAYRPFGGSWSAEVLVNNDGGSSGQFYPDVAFLTVDGYPTFMAVWQANNSDIYKSDIYFAINIFGNWGALQGKVNDVSSNTFRPRITADQAGTAYVVWEDHRDGFENKEVYFSYRTPVIFGGWSSNKKINDDGRPPVSQNSPSIAVNPADGSAFAVWEDDRLGSYNIFASFRPGGGNWGENLKINDDNAGQRLQSSPAVALDAAGNAFAWWVGRGISNLYGEPSQNDIFFFFRPQGGTWQAQGTVNDVPISVFYYPGSLVGAVDSRGNAVTAWPDIRNGRVDIYSSMMRVTLTRDSLKLPWTGRGTLMPFGKITATEMPTFIFPIVPTKKTGRSIQS